MSHPLIVPLATPPLLFSAVDMFEDMNEINDMMGRSYSNPVDIDEVLTWRYYLPVFPFVGYFAFSLP
jgi:hypothetical protein